MNTVVRFIFNLLIIFTFSCAHNYYLKNNLARQCLFPVPFAVTNEIPKEYRDIMFRGVLYWNEALKKEVFFNFGVVDYSPYDPETGDFVPVGLADSREESLRDARAKLRWGNNGCMILAKIVLNKRLLKKDPRIIETVIRHEAGHVLGLGHSDVFTDLMWYNIDRTQQHPVDASDDEIERLKKLYRRR